MNWLIIIESRKRERAVKEEREVTQCVSIMATFVSTSVPLQLLRLMQRVQRPVDSVKAATTVCETVLAQVCPVEQLQ